MTVRKTDVILKEPKNVLTTLINMNASARQDTPATHVL